MSFDWVGYYQLARELAEQANRDPKNAEAKLRSSISRAYYAVFNLARAYLIEHEPDLLYQAVTKSTILWAEHSWTARIKCVETSANTLLRFDAIEIGQITIIPLINYRLSPSNHYPAVRL